MRSRLPASIALPLHLVLPLALALVSTLAAFPSAAGAICLDWPIGADQAPGKYITIQQDYANRGGINWYSNRPHAGADLQYLSLTAQDNGQYSANRPVYAAADGTVVARSYVNYPGWVLVIQHAGGTYTQYGHLNAPTVSLNQPVTRGQQIATILPWPIGGNDNNGVSESSKTNSHVHFEVRNFLYDPINGTSWGPGYGSVGLEPYQQGWFDPVREVYDERTYPETVFLRASRNVRSLANINSALITTAASGSYTLDSIDSGATSTYPWWFRIRYDGVSSGYINSVQDWGWGSYVYFGHIGGCSGSGGGSVDDATLGMTGVPGTLFVNQPDPVTVTVTNTGTSTWRVTDPVRLAAAPSNTVIWSGWQCGGYTNSATDARVFLCHDVAPGQSHDFNFSITATAAGSALLSARMVRDGVAFFGSTATSPTITVSGGGGTPVAVPVQNAGMESGSPSQFGWISNWGPNGGWAFHSGFPASNNGTLGTRFGFYSAGTTETVAQVLGERFSTFTTYTFKSWAIGGGNRQGVVPYQIGYAKVDGDLSSFVLLATATANLNGNQGWVETAGVSTTTGGSGAALGKQIIVRFGSSAAGGQSDIWFDNVTVTKQ